MSRRSIYKLLRRKNKTELTFVGLVKKGHRKSRDVANSRTTHPK